MCFIPWALTQRYSARITGTRRTNQHTPPAALFVSVKCRGRRSLGGPVIDFIELPPSLKGP